MDYQNSKRVNRYTVQTGSIKAAFRWMALSFSFASALAQSPSTQALLSRVYQAGDIDALESLAYEKATGNPADPVAHFYLGLAYYKQKKFTPASHEFKEVLRLSNSNEEKIRARQYISAIATESAAARPDNAAPTVKTPTPSPPLDAARQERIKLLQEAAKEKKRIATERFSLEIKDLKARQKRDGQSSEQDAAIEKQTNEAFERFSKNENEIDKELARQISELNQNARNKTTNNQGDTRILPKGSGIYLKNYEHLGDDSQAVHLPTENAMSAKSKSLKESKKK